MMEITAEIRALIDKAAAGMELAGDEYIDPADGLIHCKKCGGQRQTVVPCFGKPGYFMPRCICQCQREAEEQRKAAEERQRRMERIKRRKAQGLQDRYLYDYTFANDNGQNPLMDKARAYVENWKEAYRNNTGLLLFGDVGTGKSFFAGCIANALLDRDVPVLMTNFPTILNRLTGMFSEDRADFIASFDEYDLLIIDDLGVERSTEYAMEQMFFVIDSRYRSRRPMIITTNLKLAELKNPPDLAHARIYDRILERCAPILFAGKNFREENAGATKQAKAGTTGALRLASDDDVATYAASNLPKQLVNSDFDHDWRNIVSQSKMSAKYNFANIDPAHGDVEISGALNSKGEASKHWVHLNGFDAARFGWKSNQTDTRVDGRGGIVEIQRSKANDNMYAEITASQANTYLYQDIDTAHDYPTVYTVKLRYAHRNGTINSNEKIQILVGAPGHEQPVEMTRIASDRGNKVARSPPR